MIKSKELEKKIEKVSGKYYHWEKTGKITKKGVAGTAHLDAAISVNGENVSSVLYDDYTEEEATREGKLLHDTLPDGFEALQEEYFTSLIAEGKRGNMSDEELHELKPVSSCFPLPGAISRERDVSLEALHAWSHANEVRHSCLDGFLKHGSHYMNKPVCEALMNLVHKYLLFHGFGTTTPTEGVLPVIPLEELIQVTFIDGGMFILSK
jgi:hypothetical protein